MPQMPGLEPLSFLACLDIGQVADPTALAILEREMIMQGRRLMPRFMVRFMERVPLGTPYPLMVEGVKTRVLTLHGDPDKGQPFHLTRRRKVQLLIDQTGVGRPVVDMFRAAKLLPIGVTLTGGETSRHERWDEWHVPKREVVMTFQVVLQQGRFRVARALPEAELLAKEAQNFQWKVSTAGNDLYGAWREGQHDDLLLACAMGVWWGTRYAPTQVIDEDEGQQRYAQGGGNPLFQRHAIGGRR